MEAKDLTKQFGGILAVNQLSIALRERGITGLIGPNGAGKTTFFNLVTGFLSPDKGQVFLREKEITTLPLIQRPGWEWPEPFKSFASFRA